MGQKVVTMETKIAMMMAEVDARHLTVTAVCVQLGISRQTFYKWRARFAEEGPPGLVPRSRRPRSSPTTTPAPVVGMILTARDELIAEGWDSGALSIYYRLLAAGREPPTARTVHRVLVREGLVKPQPKKRRRSSYRRFEFPATDDCWQIDAFEHPLADGRIVVVFELKDDCSRYLLDIRGWPREDTLGAWTCLAHAINRYGKPRMLLSDNSLAFTGRRVNRVVLFEQNLTRLGIKSIHSTANHPQTCGKSERGHQTSQHWLHHHRAADTLANLQGLLDRYREAFNQRPHQGLNGATPLTTRTARRRIEPVPGPVIDHPVIVTTPTGNRDGVIRVAGATIALGKEYAGHPMIVFNTNEHLLIFYRHHLARELTIDRSRTYQPLRPLTDTRGLSRTRATREPNLTPPGSSMPSQPRRSTAAVKVDAPHRKNDLDRGEHRRIITTGGTPLSTKSSP